MKRPFGDLSQGDKKRNDIKLPKYGLESQIPIILINLYTVGLNALYTGADDEQLTSVRYVTTVRIAHIHGGRAASHMSTVSRRIICTYHVRYINDGVYVPRRRD